MSDLRISEDFVLRVARLANEAEDMRKAASDALKDVWGDAREEMKALGLSGSEVSREVAYLKAAIAETRLTEKDRDKADAKAEGVEGYVAILNSPRARARAREGNEYAAAKGVERRGFFAGLSEEQQVAALAYRGDEAHGDAAFESGKTNSPETAHSGIAQGRGEGRTLTVQVSSPAPATNSPSAVTPPAENTGAVVSSSAAAPAPFHPDPQIPLGETAVQEHQVPKISGAKSDVQNVVGQGCAKQVEHFGHSGQEDASAVQVGNEAGSASGATVTKFNNPRCQHPATCHFANSRDACHDCLMDWAQRPKAEQIRLWAEANEAARVMA